MSYNGIPYDRPQTNQAFVMAPAPVLFARPLPALCSSLPHRFYPIGKALSLCIRCGSTTARPLATRTVGSDGFRRRAPR